MKTDRMQNFFQRVSEEYGLSEKSKNEIIEDSERWIDWIRSGGQRYTEQELSFEKKRVFSVLAEVRKANK